MKRNIGVLALQGDFDKHKSVLNAAGASVKEIRMPEQLKSCDGLIIPGGESTTLTKLMSLYDFYEPIKDFSKKYPIMGTCAGLIMLSSEVDDSRIIPLNLIGIKTSRNAYGRQVDSFIASVEFKNWKDRFNAYFIRAPKILNIGKNVDVLAEYEDEIIAVKQNNLVAMSFHPELGDDFRVHKHFLKEFQ